jgi:hypothetical protein
MLRAEFFIIYKDRVFESRGKTESIYIQQQATSKIGVSGRDRKHESVVNLKADTTLALM